MKLVAERITKTFAGLHALKGVSLELADREILGVIGPNGSGKTTLLNVISGVLEPTAGTVRLDQRVLSGAPSHEVARTGVARTFQNVRLFGELTVLENVLVAATASPRNHWNRDALAASREAIERLELGRYEQELIGHVPFALQRRVELARAIATQPRFLLLDEPAAGLNESESDELLATLLELRDWLGCGILLVDHDLRLIMRVTERIHVLSEGESLAEGPPEQIRSDPEVIRAYLGTGSNGADGANGSAGSGS